MRKISKDHQWVQLPIIQMSYDYLCLHCLKGGQLVEVSACRRRMRKAFDPLPLLARNYSYDQ